jgi:hypothetical protein
MELSSPKYRVPYTNFGFMKDETKKASEGIKEPPGGLTLAPSRILFSYFPPEG